MDSRARAGDTLLVKSREMTGRCQTIEELNTERPTLVFFLAPTKPLQLYG
jgi:hypothetical protein